MSVNTEQILNIDQLVTLSEQLQSHFFANPFINWALWTTKKQLKQVIL